MALVVGENSYVDLADANAYFAGRLGTSSWDSLTNSDKEKALQTATRHLDTYEWAGTALDPLQKLAFPRVGEYYDTRVGDIVVFTETIPDKIKAATCETALHLLQNPDSLGETSQIKSFRLDVISIEGISTASQKSNAAYVQFKDMLLSGGGGMWWRAN